MLTSMRWQRSLHTKNARSEALTGQSPPPAETEIFKKLFIELVDSKRNERWIVVFIRVYF